MKPEEWRSSGRQLAALVLWDIDHTLVDTAGVSRQAYGLALRRMTGMTVQPDIDMGGRTDKAIMSDLLALAGRDVTADLLRAFSRHQGEALQQLFPLLRDRGTAMPGADRALAAVARLPGVTQSVVTGNIPSTARIKLEAFGLDARLDLDIGGFGDADTDRRALIRSASRRSYRKFGPAAATIVIGDTEHDVLGALGAGAFAVAVATGKSSAGSLLAAGAHVVLPGLEDTHPLTRAIEHAIQGARRASGAPTCLVPR